MDTKKVPFLIFLKLYGLMGTGFAQPKPNNTKLIKPKTSKWTIGLRDSLPYDLAVLSPSLYATKACANSCMVSAKIIAKAYVKNIIIFTFESIADLKSMLNKMTSPFA